jgi:poly(A) polymerase Pap1
MMSEPGSHKGITSPISLSEPTPADEELSAKLEESMKPHGVFEDSTELAKRYLFKVISMLLYQAK